MKLDLLTMPAAGPSATHQHRDYAWRPAPLLPEGDEHDDDDGDETDEGAEGADDKGSAGADDKGKDGEAEKELTAEDWRAKFEAQQRVNRDLERKTKRDKAALDRIAAEKAKGSKGADDKVDAEKVREEARTEARAEVLRDRVLDKIEAKAGRKFSLDPEDVAALVLRRKGVDDFVTSDGKIDAEAIEDALAELLESRPALAAEGGSRGRFKGSADGGSRKGSESKAPAQLTKADVSRMYAAKDYAGIEKARQEGRLKDVLGATT